MPTKTVSLYGGGASTTLDIPHIYKVNSITTSPSGGESYVNTTVDPVNGKLTISLATNIPASGSESGSYSSTSVGTFEPAYG